MGSAPDDLYLYQLALLMRVNPAEIEQWDMYHIQKLLLVRAAQNLADEELARRNK